MTSQCSKASFVYQTGTTLDMNMEMKKSSKMKSTSNNLYRIPENFLEHSIKLDEKDKQERRRQRTLKYHEKGLNLRDSIRKTAARYCKEIEEEEQKEEQEKGIKLEDADDYTNDDHSSTEDYECDFYHIGTTREFLNMEREIRHLKYFNAEGQKKIQNLKEQVPMSCEEMAKAEYEVSEEAFEKYVKEDMRRTMLALEMAEEENKIMLETTEEIKKISYKIVKVKKQIVKYEELLKHEKMCKDFLWKLSPAEWQKQQEERTQTAEKIQDVEKEETLDQNSGSELELPPVQQNANSKFFSTESCEPREETPQEDQGIVGNLEVFEKSRLYFTDHKQLLNIMAEMEEKTNQLFKQLDFIQKSVEFFKLSEIKEYLAMEKETDKVTEEIKCLTKHIKNSKAKVIKLQEGIRLFNESEDSVQKKDAVLDQLHQKLLDVHKACIGGALYDPTSSELLGDLELCMCDLLDKLENTPQEKLRPVIKEFRRERIARLKTEEKQRQDMAREELRQHRAEVMQQRALAEIKKPMGKKVMWRSWLGKKVPREQKKATHSEEEELDHFFFGEV